MQKKSNKIKKKKILFNIEKTKGVLIKATHFNKLKHILEQLNQANYQLKKKIFQNFNQIKNELSQNLFYFKNKFFKKIKRFKVGKLL